LPRTVPRGGLAMHDAFNKVLTVISVAVTVVIGVQMYRHLSLQMSKINEERAIALAARKRFAAEMAAHQRTGTSAPGEGAKDGKPAPLPATDEYEDQILCDVVFPSEIAIGFGAVGGLKHVKECIYSDVILPITHPEMFNKMSAANALISVPTGILFYGPPGAQPRA
jgi:SpoVK/Ycf46/Vps4 family AAA+-type ATPase